MGIAVDELAKSRKVPQHVGSKSIFVEELVGDGCQRYKKARQQLIQDLLRVRSPFQHEVKQGMDKVALQRLDSNVAFTFAYLVELWLRAVQTAGNRSRADLPHRFQDQECLGARSKNQVGGRNEVISRDRCVYPEVRYKKT